MQSQWSGMAELRHRIREFLNVQQQTARVLQVLLRRPRASRIFSIACGTCPDLRAILDYLPALAGELWLNDSDLGALELSARALMPIRDRCHFRPGNALKVVRRSAQQLGARFDLVMAGGLLDSFPERQTIYLLEHAWQLVQPGGSLFFTNVARGNAYRPRIGDAFVVERSEEEMRRCCAAALIPRQCVAITRDDTGMTLLVEARKEEVTQ